MTTTPDPLMRPEDEQLLRDLIGANDKATRTQERILLATMASNIAAGASPNMSEDYLYATAEMAVKLARKILAEVDRGE